MVTLHGEELSIKGVLPAEMQKAADISVLFFSAGANFWAILGHFWAILAILGHFWDNLGNFGSFLGHFCGKICLCAI